MNSCKQCNSKSCLKYQHSGYRQTEKYVFYQRAYELNRRSKVKKKIKNIEKYLIELWNKQNKRCYYTGKKMSLTGYQTNPLAMTVDRKNSNKGYVKGNVVLCCSIVNRMKQNLSLQSLLTWSRILLDFNRG